MPYTCGIGRYTEELIKGYIKHWGHENVSVLLNPIICEKKDYNIIYTKYHRHQFLDNLWFSFFLLKLDYDIYHSGDLTGPFFKRKNKFHILTVHDLMFLTVSTFFGKKSFRIWLRKKKNYIMTKLLLKTPNLIISVSKTTSTDCKRYFGVSSIILREGINVLKVQNEPIVIKNLYPNTYFLYVGIGLPHKNIQFLINAFLKSNTDKKLVICGKNHPLQENKYNNVIFLGWVSDTQLDYLYRNCTAFVFPSLYEGFGLPILEALSYGKKVLSSNAGSLGEFPSDIIYFFDPTNENSLIFLLENIDKMETDKIRIENFMKYYAWDDIWDEFNMILKQNLKIDL